MPTDRLLHLGTGLLALSLLIALVLSGAPAGSGDDRLALAFGGWLQGLTLVLGSGMLVGHLVVRALTPPSFEEQVSDWLE